MLEALMCEWLAENQSITSTDWSLKLKGEAFASSWDVIGNIHCKIKIFAAFYLITDFLYDKNKIVISPTKYFFYLQYTDP